MPRKAKPTKHTAAEIAGKIKAATGNIGGGEAGLKDRLGGKAGHSKFVCKLCGVPAPSLKSLQVWSVEWRHAAAVAPSPLPHHAAH